MFSADKIRNAVGDASPPWTWFLLYTTNLSKRSSAIFCNSVFGTIRSGSLDRSISFSSLQQTIASFCSCGPACSITVIGFTLFTSVIILVVIRVLDKLNLLRDTIGKQVIFKGFSIWKRVKQIRCFHKDLEIIFYLHVQNNYNFSPRFNFQSFKDTCRVLMDIVTTEAFFNLIKEYLVMGQLCTWQDLFCYHCQMMYKVQCR